MFAQVLVVAFAASALAGAGGPVGGPVGVPKASTTVVASTSTAVPAYAYPTDYIYKTVTNHNVHRANHSGTAGIGWDNTLFLAAQQIANTCTFAHKMGVNGLSYGQNIAAGAQDVGTVISDLFYNGEVNAFAPYYGQASPGGNFEAYGHFTQVVWKGTTTVGCATAYCPGQGSWANGGFTNIPPYFTVCNYGPPGNVYGQFANNIGVPLGNPTVSDYP